MGSKTTKYAVASEETFRNTTKSSLMNAPNVNRMSSIEFLSRKQLADSELSNIDNITIIWLDNEINSQISNVDTQIQLGNISNHIQIFDKIDQCQRCLQRISITNNTIHMNKEKVLFIISPELALTIISEIHEYNYIKFIYIYGNMKIDQNASKTMLTRFEKIKGIYSTAHSLIAQINEDKNHLVV